jgi:hypothetical protein
VVTRLCPTPSVAVALRPADECLVCPRPGWPAALAASDIGREPFERRLATAAPLAPDLPGRRFMIHDYLLVRIVRIF